MARLLGGAFRSGERDRVSTSLLRDPFSGALSALAQLHAGRVRADFVRPKPAMGLSLPPSAAHHLAELGHADRDGQQPRGLLSSEICDYGGVTCRLFRGGAPCDPRRGTVGAGGA